MKIADRLSSGGWVVLAVALVSTAFVLVLPRAGRDGIPFWVFAPRHDDTYRPIVERWNRDHPEKAVDVMVIQYFALERRMLSGFMSGTPVADLVEVELAMAGRVFAGPERSIGFVDITDRLQSEGILDILNLPSMSSWTSRGRIYGIPIGVNPTLLAYRADIIEAAGIDMMAIETWDDFQRILSPLMEDLDGDGRVDRYLLGGWPSRPFFVEPMLRQAGGVFFDEDGRPTLDTEVNARTLATITTWCVGPGRICVDAAEQTGPGNKMRLDGTVLCSIIPDWMVSVWKEEMPGLSGKVKVIPVPAFTKGGRRTSVIGGTMLSITKSAPDIDTAWAFAKALYLSPALAERIFLGIGIISPVNKHWSLPIFDEPDPFFCGQPIGRRFIEQAPYVPLRTSSPFEVIARDRVTSAAVMLLAYAERENAFTAEALLPEARRVLALGQKDLERRVARNVFQDPARPLQP